MLNLTRSLCRFLCCMGSDTSSFRSSEVGNLSAHSAQSSLTSQDLWEAGIGRFDPARHPAVVPVAPPQHLPMWMPPAPRPQG